MPKKTGYNNHNRSINKITRFEQRWGISARDLAIKEDVKIETIHMRVRNYGNPWQRRAKPTLCEEMYGKTQKEIALELGLHPFTVKKRLDEYNDAYYESSWTGAKCYSHQDWLKDPRWGNQKRWIMPEHPEYNKYFKD